MAQTELSLDDVQVAEVHHSYPDKLIKKNHYLKSVGSPPSHRYLITAGLEHGPIGAAIWSRPAARALCDGKTIELRRFWTSGRTPKNTESYALARMMDEMLEEYELLVSYASIGRHSGGIYRATNWVNMGLVFPRADWGNREGRTMRDHGAKWRFEYW